MTLHKARPTLLGVSVTTASNNQVFGKRREQHIVILASGDRIRHMTIRPWMVALTVCFLGTMAIGYLGATTYLVLRDNLIGATMARQARMQHEYEDRIAALRAQVDRVTSRQLLDQQVVEEKVEKLLEQQMALTSRHGRIDALLQTDSAPDALPTDGPLPAEKPLVDGMDHASLSTGTQAFATLLGETAPEPKPAAPHRPALALGYVPMTGENVADRADRLFSNMTLSLKEIEAEQLQRIEELASGASQTADEIAAILRRQGVPIDEQAALTTIDAVGGPYLAPQSDRDFNASLNALDVALTRLETVRDTAKRLPFANPAPGREITSRFGNRPDPFFGGLAMHAGIDFRAPTGTEIRSTGVGKVVTASFSGGYGNMVEIDHGLGLSTRYGHMSRILVSEGDTVETGQILGLAGSTGRSTGPHLHYEIRRNGAPVDPMRFLNAGMKLTPLIN
ncbi:Murein DD-endopeptidase MepM and murein hydrolase activator NlpD, contain LysM domain [Rhizobium sp. RU33A]|uniref:peptidoglycan DD-metalloendopeptidase family protein n=1 Tax=Rhizobium sp. RU33A TaxID=1907413 RepID=UPI0009545D39|nr:peptidoglycan DD-metalloendopeptidase family protein [Rhizobium sp. RU33A]SIQ94748.1 Murein DD-endopeptidase MepM and murein hydrolase activator NlpD, contain LysM domain [Rhizobium sp. RU33A]